MKSLDKFEILEDKVYQDDKILLKMDDSNIMRENNITAITAQAGVGKTTFCTALATALIMRNSESPINVPKEDNNITDIVYIDTEQSQADAARIAKRIKYKSNVWVSVYALKGYYDEDNNTYEIPSNEEKKALIEEIVRAKKPKVLFIDGITDLMDDVNSQSEACSLTTWCTTLAESYHMNITTVIHQNEGNSTDNVKLRGWLGAEITRKADCVISLSRSKEDANSLKASTTKVRSSKASVVNYRMNEENGYNFIDFSTKEATIKDEKDIIKYSENLRLANLTDTEFTRKDYEDKCKVTEKTAREHLKLMQRYGKVKNVRCLGQTKYYKYVKY